MNMGNPYQSPAAANARGYLARTWLFWAAGLVAAFFSTWVGVVAVFVVPAFVELFQGFGADLPLPTRMVLSGHYGLLLSPAAALGLWLFWWIRPPASRPYSLVTKCFIVLAALDVFLLPGVMLALYMPMDLMGSQVGGRGSIEKASQTKALAYLVLFGV